VQTPRHRHWQPDEFGDDRTEASVPKALFERGQHILFTASFAIDDAIRMQSRLRYGRSEEIGSGQTPEHLALGSRRNASGEERRGRAIDSARTAARDFVDRSVRKSAAG
jgi:hypothetical protein